MNSDLIELLSSLNQYKVKFLIIGGYAFGVHAEPRYTKDLDIWVESTPANAKKVLNCLRDYGAPVSSLVEKNFVEPGFILIFGREPNRVDILNHLKGLTFKEAYKTAKKIMISGIEIKVVSLDHLILLKKLANRPQDRLDVKKLIQIKKRIKVK
jgi:predicted nucleotidyltransferase